LLGLKPNGTYSVEVQVTDQALRSGVLTPPLQALTAPLPEDFPTVSVFYSDPARMEPGFTLLDLFRRVDGSPGARYAIIVDHAGNVVWYSTLDGVGNADGDADALRLLPNGNLFVEGSEIDLLGNVVKARVLQDPGIALHHDWFPTEHGTILNLSAESRTLTDYPSRETDPNAPTQTAEVVGDIVMEYRDDGSVLHAWPLLDMLDPRRLGYASLSTFFWPGLLDWSHANAVGHDPRDDSVIVSVRHQHAPMITPAGTLLLFDNGNFGAIPFDGADPVPDAQNFSRVVEYAIDEATMEVRQVWEYGSQLEWLPYSPTQGDADWMPTTGNILITSSDTRFIAGVPTTAWIRSEFEGDG
jgi:hypothetical protein